MKSTAALEVLLGLPPLLLFLEGEFSLSRSLCHVSLVLKRRVLYTTGPKRSTRIQGFIDSIADDLNGHSYTYTFKENP
jgi:hypothetical protein